MRIGFTEKIITPEIGVKLAGYGLNDVSVAKLDELYMSVLVLDNTEKKVVILSYDLLGLQDFAIKRIRREVAALFGGEPSDVILSCTHTHSGPHTRMIGTHPELLEFEYLENLIKTTVDAVGEVLAKPFLDTYVHFFAQNCDENINRRYIGPDNRCSYLPHRRDLARIADGICDKEMGGLCFFDKETTDLVYIMGNFAAHPLAGHSQGIGACRISADFPGEYRKYLKEETGAGCMYLTGAAGNMFPRGFETGVEAMHKVGTKLATVTVDAIIMSRRLADTYRLKNESLHSCIETRTYKVREVNRARVCADCDGQLPLKVTEVDEVNLDVQLLSIGDVCLVGVPGEMLVELGLEIKWHSPFQKTYILYNSTSYSNYICHGNALVSGGYEAKNQNLDSRAGLQMVNAAVDGAYTLYERTYPDPAQWPQSRHAALYSLRDANPFF